MCEIKRRTQGMNWIRKEKRLAIYLRDGLACIYCKKGVESGSKLTLDHVICRSKGGNNAETNLVTACHKCNTERGTLKIGQYLKKMGLLNLETHINYQTSLKLTTYKAQANEILASRNWNDALSVS